MPNAHDEARSKAGMTGAPAAGMRAEGVASVEWLASVAWVWISVGLVSG